MTKAMTFTPRQLERFERLAEKLSKVPKDHAAEIDRMAATFVSGLETGIRLREADQTPATRT